MREAQGWLINDEIRTPLLIGAGGHFCPVARLLGGRDIAGSSVVAAQEIEFAATADQLRSVRVEPEVPELYFCEDLQGYGWCFRKGDFLNIGLGRVDPQGLSSHLENFCEYLRTTGRVECEISSRFHGHAYQLYERVQPALVDDVCDLDRRRGRAGLCAKRRRNPSCRGIWLDCRRRRARTRRATTVDQISNPTARRIVERFGTPRTRVLSIGCRPDACGFSRDD